MKKSTVLRKMISIGVSILLVVSLLVPDVFATQETPQKAVARPLVIMMEYADYKFTDIDIKERWRLRKIPGDKYTLDFVQQMMFGEDFFEEDGKKFITLRNYYEQVSGNSFSFQGEVVGPYTSKYNASYYGADNNKNGTDQDEAMLLVREAIQKVAKDPNVDLSKFDIENRLGKGEFGIPDGVIDTVIVIHPGIGEEWGGGSLGERAIWPFRVGFSWYWENDFQMEKVVDHEGEEWLFDDFILIAQDSAVDMLLHEYGHILGLPDLYGRNTPPVQWWDIMGGAYTGKDIAGSMPISYGGYSREFLQKSFKEKGIQNAKWTNYGKENILNIDENGLDIELHQAHERLDNKKDLFRIDLPARETTIVNPVSGEYAYFSGKGNDLRNFMKTIIDLTDYEKAKLKFKTWYKIDPYFDFATIRINQVGSEEWETIKGNITTTKVDDWIIENETEEQRRERNPGHGITNDSKGWIDAEFDLSEYAGKVIQLKFYFWTDTNTPEEGIYIDNIVVNGARKGEILEESEEMYEKEPNDIPEQANNIKLNTKMNGKFEEGDSADYFKLNIIENTQINVYTETDGTFDLTWGITLEDSEEYLAWPGGGIRELESGTYYLSVWPIDYREIGNYTIKVSTLDKSTDLDENWEVIFEDDAEGEPKFDLEGGFTKSMGKENSEHYYLLEWRNIEEGKVDEGLRYPYYDWEQINYDPGLLVWYINTRYVDSRGRPDQDVVNHPGECFAGIVKSDQNPIIWETEDKSYRSEDGRADINMHDAAFSLRMENEIYHKWSNGVITRDLHPFMVPEFDDSKDYTFPTNLEIGLKLPDYGIKILVIEEAKDRSSAKVHIMNRNLENNPVDYSDGLNVIDINIADDTINIYAENNGSKENLGRKAYIGYIKEDSERKSVEAKEELVIKQDGLYTCSTDFLLNVEKGVYKVNFVILEDAEGNVRAIYNSDVHSGYGMDLSKGDIDNTDIQQ